MSSATRSELLRLTLTLTPALVITAIGGIALIAGASGLGLIIGGGVAAVLVALAGLMVAASHGAALRVAAFAALGSFVVRIGGAGATAFVIGNHLLANEIIIGLALGLLAALVIDLLTWFRIARSADALMTSAKESARA